MIETFAKGTPVLCSDIGSVGEPVEPGRTGLRFRAGDADDLASALEFIAIAAILDSAQAASTESFEAIVLERPLSTGKTLDHILARWRQQRRPYSDDASAFV